MEARCTDPMKDVPEINFIFSCDWLKDNISLGEELWENKNVLDSMWHPRCILDY